MTRRVLLILLGLFFVAQFIQPDRRVQPPDPARDLLVMTQAPEHIRTLVTDACYDCHSDHTAYPFWTYITPVNFWVQHHVEEAREELNFSRWDLFAGTHEASESGEHIAGGEMPLPSYAWLHPSARLTDAQRAELTAWFDAHTGGGR